MALAAGVMDFVVSTRGRDPGEAALSSAMAIGTVGGKRHTEGMVFAAMFGGKEAVTAITARAAALANGDGNQRAGRPVTGSATAVLLCRTTNRYTTDRPLCPAMAAGTIGRKADQGAMIFGGVAGCKAAMTGIASAAARVTTG